VSWCQQKDESVESLRVSLDVSNVQNLGKICRKMWRERGGKFVGRFVGKFVGRFVGSFVGKFVGRFAGKSVGRCGQYL